MKHTQNEEAVSPVIGVIKGALWISGSPPSPQNTLGVTYGWNYRSPRRSCSSIRIRNSRTDP